MAKSDILYILCSLIFFLSFGFGENVLNLLIKLRIDIITLLSLFFNFGWWLALLFRTLVLLLRTFTDFLRAILSEIQSLSSIHRIDHFFTLHFALIWSNALAFILFKNLIKSVLVFVWVLRWSWFIEERFYHHVRWVIALLASRSDHRVARSLTSRITGHLIKITTFSI